MGGSADQSRGELVVKGESRSCYTQVKHSCRGELGFSQWIPLCVT